MIRFPINNSALRIHASSRIVSDMRRTLRIASLTVLCTVGQWISQTTPYLGVPLEPKPVFMDCYEQALWNGRVFTPTGKTICLGQP